MIPTTESTTVYRGGGRRWMTKRAACNAAAKAKIKTRCECEKNDHGPMGIEHLPCAYHADLDRFHKIVSRLARIYFKAMTAKDAP